MNRAEHARFMRQVKVQPNGCWIWTGQGNTHGYGMFQPSAGKQRQMVHRWAYESFVGQIPERYQIDHKCHTDDESCLGGKDCQHRRCCNPSHLEAVTASENTMRQRHYERSKTECPKGHPYEGDNLILGSDNRRRCRTCDRARKRTRSDGSEPPTLTSDTSDGAN
jgi:hypothetical protein